MRKIVLLVLVIAVGISAHSQLCGFDGQMAAFKKDPAFAKMIAEQDAQIRAIIKSGNFAPPIGPNGVPLYTIPVVVHVVHAGGEVGSIYNPTNDRITQTIDYINKVWDGTATGLSGGVGDMQIQFVLAKRDPNCNPTNGIDRVNGGTLSGYASSGIRYSGANGATELTVKNQSRWDPSKYYNIWVVNKIDGVDGTAGQFIAGYAYFPGAPSSLDGTVMLATQFTTDNKVLPHELGHAFALYHPFEGSNNATQCPTNFNCSVDGDQVCDTDPISNNAVGGVNDFTCRTGTNNCTGSAYSINTENNIMSYTNCFTLFTAGQKTRALAAMLLPSRASLTTSLGATPTNLGSVICAPKINFETSQASIAESPAATMDCRKYKDYIFNLNIGSNPSANATAELTIEAGTATNNQDYIISTNGSFIEPSRTVTFPTGSSGNSPFTIRVFDDGSIESPETIFIGFTLNNGGGNAVKGDARIVMVVTITDNDVEPQPSLQSTKQVGSGSLYNLGDEAGSAPLDAKLSGKKTTWIYKASELTAAGFTAGNFSQFGIYLQKNSTRAFSNLQIKMGHTTRDYLVEGVNAVLVTTSTVKTLASYATVNEWNLFNLDVPFTWDGIRNVAVEICYGNGTASAIELSDVALGYSDGGIATQGATYWQNNITCAANYSSIGYFQNGVKPLALFTQGVTGPKTESVLDATNTSYLGPFADMYFYSNSGNILGKIRNLSNWDYGCTSVKVDRAGTGTKGFVNNSTANAITDKTIFVTPANNNQNGQYEITLFYRKAEVDGYKAATGLFWSNTGIAKTKNAVSSYTPGTVPPGLAEISAAISRNAYGDDSTITAQFNTGFSGFGVINASIQLPVNWLSFTGKMVQDNAVLNWSTASEYNNLRFDVEVSRNGRDYSKLGDVNSRGNSSLPQAYSFTHLKPIPGINYYRLKQVDKDGRFSYSAIVPLQTDAANAKPSLYPNPVANNLMLNWGNLAGKKAQWELLGADMKLLNRGAAFAGSTQQNIPVSQLSAGVYFVRLISDGDTQILRFVKQ